MDRGWAWVVLAACSLSLFTQCAMIYSVGVIHVALLETYREDNARTAWVGALHSSLQSVAGPIAGAMVELVGNRVSMFLGGVLVLLGCALSALVDGIGGLMATYGVIGGLGLSLCMSPCVVAVGFHFERYRGLAASIAMTGGGMGMFAGGPIVQLLLDSYGLKGTFLMLGAIGLHNSLFAMVIRPSRLELRMKKVAREARRRQELQQGKLTWFRRVKHSMLSYLTLFRFYGFLCHTVSILLWQLGFGVVMLHLPRYAQIQGSSPGQAVYLLTAVGIGSLAARLLSGSLLTSEAKSTHTPSQETEVSVDVTDASEKAIKNCSDVEYRKGGKEDSTMNEFEDSRRSRLEDSKTAVPEDSKAAALENSTKTVLENLKKTPLKESKKAGFKNVKTSEPESRFDALTMHMCGVGLSALVTMLFPLYSTIYEGQLAFALLFGLYCCMALTIITPLTAELAGLVRLPSAMGFELMMMGLGYLVGPYFAGLIVDNGGSYQESFFMAGVVMLVGSLLSLVTSVLHRRYGPGDSVLQDVELTVEAKEGLQGTPLGGSLTCLASTHSLAFCHTDTGSMRLVTAFLKSDSPTPGVARTQPRGLGDGTDSVANLDLEASEPFVVVRKDDFLGMVPNGDGIS